MKRILEPEYMDTPEEADGYDSMDHGAANDAFLTRLRELGVRGHMLDIGTGPAHIPLRLLESMPDVTIVGIDAAHHMLRHAERRRLASKDGARLRLQVADAKALPFPDAAFSAVFSNTVMHHIPDPVPYLREAWRVLEPGGALLIRDLFRPPDPERALELVRMHAAGADPYQQELFRASLHAAFLPLEFETMVRDAGLTGHEIVIDTDRHMSLQVRSKGARNNSSAKPGDKP